jgi:hypothetical protein
MNMLIIFSYRRLFDVDSSDVFGLQLSNELANVVLRNFQHRHKGTMTSWTVRPEGADCVVC